MPTNLAPRIIAVSPDAELGQRLATALAGVGGTVAVHQTLDNELRAELLVLHLDDEHVAAASELLPRWTTGPIIIVLRRSNLAGVVELMRVSERVAGVVAAEDFEPHRLSAMASRILADDIFGLEKVVAPGTQIHAQAVSDYQEKLRYMAVVAEFVEQIQEARKLAEPIEQCLDEMLMNALYDAPIDERGAHIFAGVPTRTRITMRTDHSVAVHHAYDGKQVAISVRDSFGTLQRQTVLDYLHKCLHGDQPIDRKAGGAGVGLYLMLSASTAVFFNVLPGIATEAICVFELERPKRLEQFGFVVQIDAAGRVGTGPARQLLAASLPAELGRARRARWPLIALVMIGLLGALLIPRIFGGAEPEVATLELDSEPTDAETEIDGKPMGSTPLTVTSLSPGTTVSIVFKRIGYHAATARLQVPMSGHEKRLVQKLDLSDEFVRVQFVSKPPGAQIVREGRRTADRTYTPADVFVEANQTHHFTLIMPTYVPLLIAPFTPPRGAGTLEKGGTLVKASRAP